MVALSLFTVTVSLYLPLYTFNFFSSDELLEPFLQNKTNNAHSFFFRNAEMFQRQVIQVSDIIA